MINNEIIVKKSKFITYLYELDDESKVSEIIDSLKKEYKKATHICYAYIINGKEKAFDDKEPNGTAGKPILTVLEKRKENNKLIVVIRYFGGIKLGAGGLFRSYLKSASEILKIYEENKYTK